MPFHEVGSHLSRFNPASSQEEEQQKTEYVERLFDKYYKRYIKRISGKPEVTQIIAIRSFNTAVYALDAIKDISYDDLALSVYIYCHDEAFKDIAREFESQIELAGANPEKFIFGLHKFYTNITNTIKSQGLYQEIVGFISAYLELMYTKDDERINRGVVYAYVNLLLQTMEYLRPDKFNLRQSFIGVSTDGCPMTGEQFMPYADFPTIKMRKMMIDGRKFKSQDEWVRTLLSLYEQQGHYLRTNMDVMEYEEIQKIRDNTYAALLPFVNEYTSDILPQKQYSTMVVPLLDMLFSFDMGELLEELRYRKRTLPVNGVSIAVDDPAAEIQGLLLKEIVKNNAVYLLYRISTPAGDLSGYYNTKSGFLFSIAKDATDVEAYDNLKALVLCCYALCTTDRFVLDKPVLFQDGQPMRIRIYGLGNRLKNVYTSEDGTSISPRAGNPDFDKKTAAVNGYIRKLPVGQSASEEAKATAIAMGYRLDADETYVKPFCKVVFTRRESSQIQPRI